MRKRKAKRLDEALGPDAVRIEATEAAGELAGARRVVGTRTAAALVATGRWRVCDARHVTEEAPTHVYRRDSEVYEPITPAEEG